MEKVIRDGEVAVLISQGFGTGWYSWYLKHPELLFHPKLVEMVEQGRRDEIDDDWVKEHLGIDMYAGGAGGLGIYWLPVGTAFTVTENGGYERLQMIDEVTLIA